MGKSKPKHLFSIKRSIILFFVLILTTSTILSGFLIFSRWLSSETLMINDMAEELNVQVESDISTFMNIPKSIEEINHLWLENGIINLTDDAEREKFFVGILNSCQSEIYSFSFGSETGEYYGARRNAQGDIEIMRNNADTDYHTAYYSVNDDMTAGALITQTQTVFDARTRDWYIAAKSAGDFTFSPVYKHFIMNDLTVSAAYPIYDDGGVLLGVLGTHVILTNLDTFLKTSVNDIDGLAVIVEIGSGALIGNTLDYANYIVQDDLSVKRSNLNELGPSVATQAFARYVVSNETQFTISDDTETFYFKLTEYHETGVDWLIISAVPKSHFGTDIASRIWVTVILMFATIFVAIVLYLLYTRRAFEPIKLILDATKSYSAGDYSARIQLIRNDEVGQISTAINTMADQIETAVNQLEFQISERTRHLEESKEELLETNEKLSVEMAVRASGENRLNLFFEQSLSGFFFMMLDEPVYWNDSTDKEATLDYIFDHQKITAVNPAMLDQYKMTLDDLMKKTPCDMFSHNISEGRDTWRKMLDNGHLHVETDERRSDGTAILIEGDYICMYDDLGRFIGHFGNQFDVTERREMERALHESNEKYIAIFEKSPIAIEFYNANGILMHANDACVDLFGVMDRKELKGFNLFDNPNIDSATKIKIKNQERINQEIVFSFDEVNRRHLYITRCTGTKILKLSITPLINASRLTGFVVQTEDITDRKQAESDLIHSRDLLSYIVDHANGGVAVHDRDLKYLYVSAKYMESYGIGGKEVIGKHHYDVFPDLPQKWRTIHQLALNGVISRADNDPYEHADGSVDWTRWECRPWYESESVIGGIIVYTEVINEQKRLEQELLNEKETLLATLYSIGDGVISTDTTGRITRINAVAEALTGWSEKNAISVPYGEVFDIIAETSEKICTNPVETVIETQEILEIGNHTILISRDLNRHFIEYTASPIKIDKGGVIGVVLVFRDVTEKKQKLLEIDYLSKHDYLTGLYNRRYYVDIYNSFAKTAQYPLGIMMMDVNGLKIINDAYGHDIGDIALKTVSDVLTTTFDAKDIIARIGGDEFAILLPNTTIETMQAYKESLYTNMISRPIFNIAVSLAIGYEIKIDENNSLDEMLKMAENHMYRHKLADGVGVRNRAIQAILSTLTEKYRLEKTHSERVSSYARQIGEAMELRNDEIKELEMAGLFHDIGKISIPDSILEKPGKLTSAEYEIIKTHTEVGYQILRAADEYSDLAIHALHHHEHWDGNGYPGGLKGNDIPLFSRIICVIDAFEAMTAERPYKKPLSFDSAIEELKRCSGTQFDPEIVSIFVGKIINSH